MSRTNHPVDASTLPALLLARARVSPHAAALRFHQLGIWEQETWESLAQLTRTAGNALAAMGVARGDVVGLVASNQPAWVVADLAIQGLGAVTLAIDPDFSPATVVTLLQTNAATTVVVGDQEQYDKVVESRSLLPRLQRIVVINPRGLRLGRDGADTNGTTVTWAKLLQTGGQAADVWTASAESLDPDATVTVEAHVERDASGHMELRAHTATSQDLLGAADDLRERLGAHAGDELHPIASFADPLERTLSEALAMRVGAVMNIGEGGDLLASEARDVQPTIAHLPAQRLRQMRSDVESRRAQRGIRRLAVDRVLQGSGNTSRSSSFDLRVMQGVIAALAVASAVVHRTLVDQSGAIRLAIVAALCIAATVGLVGGGFAVRPFIRKAYGLSRAHSLLTGPDIDVDTVRFLGALRLNPILERRAVTPTNDVEARP